MNISSIGVYQTNFCRKLKPEEENEYKNDTIKPALDYLGVQEVSMILHGSAYPESRDLNNSKTNNDISIGTPYGKVAAQLIPFEILHGFNSNQLGPIGELNSVRQISPYKSSVGANNYLFIDFNKLTEDEYANILNSSDITDISAPISKSELNYSYTDYPEAFANYDYLIGKAYSNFQIKLKEQDSNATKLNTEFKKYQDKNPEIKQYALFYILKNIYGNEDYLTWKDIDKNLANDLKDENNYSAQTRLKQIKKKTGDKFDQYCFAQFLLDKQIKENAVFRKELNFKYISDMLVGFSPADEWIHQDIFLKDYYMGCPYGGPDGGIQRWNVPVLDPKKLFNKDGSIGKSGEFLKTKLEKSLNNFENIRIDHALGLIDPFIYQKNGNRSGNISQMPDIDPEGNFQKVLDKIVLPTLKENGIDKNTPVWEDLVTETPVFNRIYHNEKHIPGVSQLAYKRAEAESNPDNWFFLGSHDDAPANELIKMDWIRNNEAWNPMYLAGVLNANSNSELYCQKLDHSDSERVKAKFAELFMMGKKVQISFADFFGITKTYNQGGNDLNPDNWKLRLNSDYEDTYYKNLSSPNPTALNMPEVLKMAVQGKAEMDIVKGKDSDEVWGQTGKLLYMLDKYANILKEQ